MNTYKEYRFKNNPKEQEFVEKFWKEYGKYPLMEQIVFGTDERGLSKDNLSEREELIVLSTIQWLGSPVGQGFLNSCGFELKAILYGE